MTFNNTGVYTYGGTETEFHYAITATYLEQVAFVASVTDAVVTPNNYLGLLKDIVFKLKLVQMFTDIEDDVFTNEDDDVDIDKFAEWDLETGVSTQLIAELDDNVFHNIVTSLEDNIAYRTGIHQPDEFLTALADLVRGVADRFVDSDKDIDPETTMAFMKKFNESGFDGESIADAYFNSDTYKQNTEKVLDKKNEEIRELRQKLNDKTSENVVADKPVTKRPSKKATKNNNPADSQIEVVPKDK